MRDEIVVGDWVRFYQNGRLVIGQVQYVTEGKFSGEHVYCTDIGSTSCVMEWGHKP